MLRTLAAGGLALLAFTGTALAQGKTVEPITVATASVADDKLVPGIRASYWYAEFEHVDAFVKATGKKQGWTPTPIAALDKCDANGKLYEAGVIENYGIKGVGFIRFPKEGEWKVAAKSNDGIRLFLDGKLAIEDPAIHGDRMSKPITVTVPAAGLVPVEFFYFQKKGSACLQLHWQGPGETAMSIVPGAALANQKP